MSDLLNSASLVLIPSGYKEDVLYSQVPTDGSADMVFTRASNGTRINSAGLVEVCPWNLMTYSEQFQNSDWLGGGNGKPTMTDNFAEAPNGTMTASKMEAVSDGYQVRQNNAQENTQMNLSVWLRTNTGTKTIQLFLNNASTASQNITVTTTWTRYEINGLVTSLSGGGRNGLNTLEALTSSAYILVWGFQLSVSTTAKPYFPTTDRLNVPRLTYQNGGGGCPSLLLEKQSTNIYPNSEQLNAWDISSASVVANTMVSPDGCQNADSVSFVGTNGLVYMNATGTTGTTNTLSVYAKATSGTSAKFRFFGNGNTMASSDFTATDVWQRFEFSYNCTQVTAGLRSPSTGDSNVTFWGFQHEVSTYATSYIPTTSASATRVADACYKTGISSLIGQSEGTIYWEGYITPCGAYNSMASVEVLNTRFINLRLTDINRIEVGTSGLSSDFTITSSSPATSGTYYKIAAAYKSGDNILYVNGVQIGTSATTYTTPTLTDFNFNVWNVFNEQKSVFQTVLFKTRLTNAELASLTTI